MKIKIACTSVDLKFKTNENFLKKFIINTQGEYALVNQKLTNPLVENNFFKINISNNKIQVEPKTINYSTHTLSLLLNIYSLLSILRNGIMLHSSGCVVKNKAILFCGEKNSGKSTVVNRLPYPILSDDIIIVKRIGNKVFAFPTPFGISTTKNKPFKIKKIYFLKTGKKKCVSELPFRQTVRNMFVNSLIPTRNTKYIKKGLNNIVEISKRVKSYLLPRNQIGKIKEII